MKSWFWLPGMCRRISKPFYKEASESKNLEKIAGRVVRNGLLGAFAAKAAARVAERAGKKNGVAAELLPVHAFILE